MFTNVASQLAKITWGAVIASDGTVVPGKYNWSTRDPGFRFVADREFYTWTNKSKRNNMGVYYMKIINKKLVISILLILGVCSIIFVFILFKTNNKMVVKRVFKVKLPENAEIIECSKKNDYYAAKVKMPESDVENFTKSLDNWVLVNLSLAKSLDDIINNQKDTFVWWNFNSEDVEYYYTKYETKNSLFGPQERPEYFIFITKEVNNERFVYFLV